MELKIGANERKRIQTYCDNNDNKRVLNSLTYFIYFHRFFSYIQKKIFHLLIILDIMQYSQNTFHGLDEKQ